MGGWCWKWVIKLGPVWIHPLQIQMQLSVTIVGNRLDFDLPKTSHNSFSWVNYEISFMSILEVIDNIAAAFFMCFLLTLNVLNCFEDYKRCIHISYHILDFIQQKKIKFTMEQSYVLPILYCQCRACWCTGDFRSQCINKHGIDFQSRNIPSLAWKELRLVCTSCSYAVMKYAFYKCCHPSW